MQLISFKKERKETDKMKREIAFFLALVMVFALCGCGVEKNDEGFLKNVQTGIEKRITYTKTGQNNISGMDGMATYYANCANEELRAIGDVDEYIFTDSRLEQIAYDYVAALNKQVTGAKDYNGNYQRFSEQYYSNGYYPEAELICILNEEYGLTAGKNYTAEFNKFLEDGQTYVAIQNLVTEDTVLESIGGSRSAIVVDNTSMFDLSGAQLHFNFFDDDGLMVDDSSCYFQSLQAGCKQKAEVYAQKKFTKAEVSVSCYLGSAEIKTAYKPIKYVNNMIVELELVTELPKEFAYKDYSKGIIKSFGYEESSWSDGKASLKLHISGEKTYDGSSSGDSNSCYFDWRVLDEDGVVIDTGSFYVDKLKVGESFKDVESYVSKLEVGKYYIEITDHT